LQSDAIVGCLSESLFREIDGAAHELHELPAREW
jgi:hypothetical protein